ncbi:hypothetical protein D9M71_828310 [compost metagenome]
MSFRLRYAEQGIDFWHQHLESAALAQHFDKYLRLIFQQCAGNFFPATFGGQCLQFARLAELAHQLQRFRCDGEAQFRITSGKARNT